MKPVAWMQTYKGEANNIAWTKLELDEWGDSSDYKYIPLYTAPRELSDEEILELTKDSTIFEYREFDDDMIRFAKAILKKASDK